MLVLTYNPQFKDGFVAQYQRILGIYAICKHFNIAYYHTNFSDIHYQGLNALMKNENNKEIVDKLNDRINIKSDITDIKDYPTTKKVIIKKEEILELKEKYKEKNMLIYLQSPYKITDLYPELYLNVKNIYKTIVKKNEKFTIGMHVRRGELYVVDGHRMLPNKHYINICNKLVTYLKEKNIDFIVELYTEVPDKKYTITKKHVGIDNRIKKDVIIDPNNNKVEEFDILPNLDKYINESILLTFDRMINCDVLIGSRSSLSACASYIKKGVTIYKPFWHKMIKSDISCDNIQPIYEYIQSHNKNKS